MDSLMGPLEESHYPFLFHYYRAEVYRETNWRNRMDVTTYWAIVSTAAILTFVFSNEIAPHTLVLVNYLMVFFFLNTEARRYRYYILLKKRTRLLEEMLLSPMFSGEKKSSDWHTYLADSLKKPRVSMSRLESIAWRTRRNYIFLFTFIFCVWIAKLASIRGQILSFGQIIERAQVMVVPGEFVFGVMLFSLLFLLFIAFYLPKTSDVDDLP
jgi:uncharacterized membrane protein